MALLTDLTGAIVDAATSPQSVQGDMGSVTSPPVADLIAADRYLSARAGRGSRNRGILFSKLIPAAACADRQGTATGTGSFEQGSV